MGNTVTKENEQIVEDSSIKKEKLPEKPKRNWYLEAQQIQASFIDEEKLQQIFLQRFKDIKLKTLDLSRMGRILFDQNDFEIPLSLSDKLIQTLDIKEIEKINISHTLFSKIKRTVDEFPSEIFLIQQLKEANKVQFPIEILQFKNLKELKAIGCDIAEIPKGLY